MACNTTSKGFTLIEMLVVLVITALTATILVSGLETTWRNFEKLSSNYLQKTSAQLPKQWFAQSMEGVILRQHTKSLFSGDEESINFYTVSPPNNTDGIVKNCNWLLQSFEAKSVDLLISCNNESATTIAQLSEGAIFEYLTQQGWLRNFQGNPGQIPKAVRITSNSRTWVTAVTGRPSFADVPAEIPITGQYEF